jgi:APA family basic amino acid/polyamine antiporter
MVDDSIPATPSLTEQKQSRGHLLKVLGVGFGLAVIIGNTIGAGIFRAPGTIAEQLPNVWLYLGVWVAGGLYALLGAISIAELGAMIPRSGGQYVFVRYALGEYAGFIVGWSDWISTCGSTAGIAMVMASFAGGLFPILSGTKTVLMVAASVTLGFALLQWRGIVLGSATQNIISTLKALAFLFLIVAAFVFGGPATAANTAPPPSPVGPALAVAIVLSLQAVIYTYDGWTGVIYFSEEVKNPGRDIPRSMIGGVLSVIAIYLLVNLALVYLLPLSEIAGKEFAAGTAAGVIFGRYGDTIFRSLTIVSMLGAINATHLMATRTLYAMSRDGLFWARAANVNRGGTPAVALFLGEAVTLLFILFGRTFDKVVTIIAFFFVAMYALSFISVFVLRRREPDKARPYRVWGYPWTTAIVLLGSILFLAGAVASDTQNSIYALLLLAVSYPVFLLLKRLS